MPISFADEFGVKPEVITFTGVFNVILDVDTRVFIDPALLKLTSSAHFRGARQKIEEYFGNIITLLSHSKTKKDMYWKEAEKRLTFQELTGTCFGYSKTGTSGNAIGKGLRTDILSTIKELVDDGEKDPVLFELLGVFQERIGCDRISDLITFILSIEIFEYSEWIVKEAGIQSINVTHDGKSYAICNNQYNNKPLLLLPEDILSPLPVVDSFDDIDNICRENERVRQEINTYLDLGNKKKLEKKKIVSLMQSNKDFRKSLITAYKDFPVEPYNFSLDPIGEYIWYPVAKEYTENFPIKVSKEQIKSDEDVLEFAKMICEKFKSLVEDNNLNLLLYDQDKKTPKHESAAQLLFYGIADSYCVANNLDLTKEGNNGRGPVDFKLSNGSSKVVVEIKLTSNGQLKHGFEKQLPIYMKQEKTKKAIYLIIDNGHPKSLEKFVKFYNEQDSEIKSKINYIVIDATLSKSASIA